MILSFIIFTCIIFPYIRITMISSTISLVNCAADLCTVSVLGKLINSQECIYMNSINHSPSHSKSFEKGHKCSTLVTSNGIIAIECR